MDVLFKSEYKFIIQIYTQITYIVLVNMVNSELRAGVSMGGGGGSDHRHGSDIMHSIGFNMVLPND